MLDLTSSSSGCQQKSEKATKTEKTSRTEAVQCKECEGDGGNLQEPTSTDQCSGEVCELGGVVDYSGFAKDFFTKTQIVRGAQTVEVPWKRIKSVLTGGVRGPKLSRLPKFPQAWLEEVPERPIFDKPASRTSNF